jgi:S-DNA-T family DNA segregation ATPase FtsK/SpoIIIE
VTTDPLDSDELRTFSRGADVIPFRKRLEDDQTDQPADLVDTSFEIDLDEEPAAGPPVLVDQPAKDVEIRPIIPLHLRPANIRATATRAAQRGARIGGYHAVRSWWYALLTLFWGVWGVLKLLGREIRWAWLAEATALRQEAADSNDAMTYSRLLEQARKVRMFRFMVLACQMVAVLVATMVLWLAAPRWVAVLVAAVALPLLAHFGRPDGRPIISPAVVKPRYRKLNSDIVLRAYYAAKLGDPEKDPVMFGGPMHRDASNSGSQVLVDLPHGRTFEEVMNALPKLASGLDVSLSQVYVRIDPSSHRRHLLFVADVDPLSIPAGRTPLLDCKPRDIWGKGAPIGLNERGRRIILSIIFTSILIGAQPRKGKTFTARHIALFCALDPYVRLSVFDAKGSPDWRRFALVAYSYGFGMLPDRVQGDPIDNLLWTLRQAKKEVQSRNVRLSELPTSVCPEGKLTREIARDPRYKMPVWVIVLDEFQDFLNTGDEAVDLEIADLLVFLIKQGPSTGVLFIDSTQRPSGIGSTGKVAKRFTDFRDNHQTRIALKTGSWQVSELILGAGAYTEGFDSSSLPVGDGTNGPDYRGIFVLYDAPTDPGTIRGYLADGKDAEKILIAARTLRVAAETLDGMAAGDVEIEGEVVDPLTDALSVFMADEAALTWARLAARLADQLPDRYGEMTKDAISARLRGLGAKSKNVRDEEGVSKGVARAELEQLQAQRAVST